MTEPVIVIDPEVMNGTPCLRGHASSIQNSHRLPGGRAFFGWIPAAVSRSHAWDGSSGARAPLL